MSGANGASGANGVSGASGVSSASGANGVSSASGPAANAGPQPLSCDPDAPLGDLAALLAHTATAAATVVGIGASCRGARELWAHQHRILRHLVERRGFRSLAIEEDWTFCLELDRYVCSGEGDLPSLLAGSRSLWCTEELLATLSWIRDRNAALPEDPVRVVGLNADSTRATAYEVVADFVRATDPPQRGLILAALAALHPGDDIAAHVWWYRSLPDRGELLDAARRLSTLMAEAEPHPLRALAQRHCAAIVDFHEYHDRAPEQVLAHAAPRMASNVLWWQEQTGHKIVYWGGIAHTLTATERTLSEPALTQPSTGSRLREVLGPCYASIGLTLGQGHVPQHVPPAGPGLSEALLDTLSDHDAYGIPLTPGQSPSLPLGLRGPAALRAIGPGYTPESDPGCVMTGGTLADWFDVLIHTHRTRPTTPLWSGRAPGAPSTRNWKERGPA
ncbi:erythromycin esterase family protein [Kitasatospora viridis]|uniref:Erythromycin esterase n=1 Tax=Kitasatospora viridis TaxID=281105 RepID=A0A561SAF4_9ACTN|nr:erythromycin esterase family protein [Kitasatospora viridis]TWF71860.1 erythromycin esterase [Kitasatospora viridis]